MLSNRRWRTVSSGRYHRLNPRSVLASVAVCLAMLASGPIVSYASGGLAHSSAAPLAGYNVSSPEPVLASPAPSVAATPATSYPTLVSTPQVGTGSTPRFSAYDAANGYVYVPDQGGSSVTVLSGSAVVATVPVGTTPFFATYDSTNGYVYVTNFGSANVSVISGTQVIGNPSDGSGSEPTIAAWDPTNNYVYVPNSASSTTVTVLSGTTVAGTINVCDAPHSAYYDPLNGYVYAPCWGSAAVSVINGLSQIGTVSVGSEPLQVAVDTDSGYLYVTNSGGASVSVINGATDTTVGSPLPVGTSPNAITYDYSSQNIYVSNSGSTTVTVLTGDAVNATVTVGSSPEFSTLDGAYYVFVPNMGSANVSVISGTTVLTSINTGTDPIWATYDSGNGWIYVSNQGTANVSLVEELLSIHVYSYSGTSGSEGKVQLSTSTSSVTLGDGQLVQVLPSSSYTLTAVDLALTFFQWVVLGGTVPEPYSDPTTLTTTSAVANGQLSEVLIQPTSDEPSWQWAGYLDTGRQIVDADFYTYVPSISYDNNFGCAGWPGQSTQEVAIWDGLGGFAGSGDLWQAGLLLSATCSNFLGDRIESTSYCLFYEEATPSSGSATTFACGDINPGDQIFVEVHYYPGLNKGTYTITDVGNGGFWTGSEQGFDPLGSGWSSGEVILEDPTCTSCSGEPVFVLPSFGTTYYYEVHFMDTGSLTQPPTGPYFDQGSLLNYQLYETEGAYEQLVATGICSSSDPGACLPGNNFALVNGGA